MGPKCEVCWGLHLAMHALGESHPNAIIASEAYILR